jgi:acyl-CoA thioesterase-2
MDARTFLGLEQIDTPFRWRLPVVTDISTGGSFLFGGCGLGAAIEAIETASGRPCVWATAQFLSYAKTGSVVHIDVTLSVNGRQTTQARAVAKVDDREIFTVNAALGSRNFASGGQWAEMPDVPGPHECGVREFFRHQVPSINQRLDQRIAKGRRMQDFDGTLGDGRSAMWVKVDGISTMSAATLGILGDWVPSGLGQALGQFVGGNSLDNTLRVASIEQTEWVLLDIRVHAINHGFGHGLVHLWSETGTLLGTASQSTIVRPWTEVPNFDKMPVDSAPTTNSAGA